MPGQIMTKQPYAVGYGRPPEHTRFQKGHSGTGVKPGLKKPLKQQFVVALSDALNGSRQALQDARPTTTIEAMARKVALDALDGRAPAQKFVLEILDGADRGAPACTRTWARPKREGLSKRPDERGGESNEEDDEEIGRSDRTNVPGAGKKAGKIQKTDITHDEDRQAYGRTVRAQANVIKFPASGNF
jgi:hypothetical protein